MTDTIEPVRADEDGKQQELRRSMPLFLEPDAFDAWLDPAPKPPEQLLELLIPAAPGRLDAFPVSTEVNNVANNGLDLIKPLPPE